jgi:hypothetical protein
MKCAICDRETDTSFGCDPDISPIGFCSIHKDEVQVALIIMLTQNDEKIFDKLRKQFKRRRKAKI